MPANENLTDLARSTSPQAIREYAKGNGWEAVRDGLKGRFYLFRHTAEPLRQLIVPMDPSNREYSQMVLDVAERIAVMENRTVETVLSDLMLSMQIFFAFD